MLSVKEAGRSDGSEHPAGQMVGGEEGMKGRTWGSCWAGPGPQD